MVRERKRQRSDAEEEAAAEMYRAGGGGSKAAAGFASAAERKRVDEALDKRLERSSPSTSAITTTATAAAARALNNGKDHLRPSSMSKTTGGENQHFKDAKSSDAEESETDSEEESDVSGSEGGDASWISWFCNLRGNELFCEIDEDYMQDDFNLCGLSSLVPYYDYALDLILDVESSHEEQNELVESAAEMLYGLMHVRFILTSKGLSSMLDKFKNAEFGRCPRVFCCGQPCLPVGPSDVPRQSTVKIYCPKCEDIYTPKSRFQENIDGAYFGTTFPHLFLMTYGMVKPAKNPQGYVPKVFGFKVHKP